MKNMVKALVADIQEQMSVAFLADTFIRFFTDVYRTSSHFPDEANVMMDLPAKDVRSVGAFWNHADLSNNMTAYVTSACNAQMFGELALLVAENAEELLAIAHAPEDNAKAALVLARAHMNQTYPAVELDVALADQLLTKESAALDEGMNQIRRALHAMVDQEDPTIHAAPATLQ
jgi:hypothetical protein